LAELGIRRSIRVYPRGGTLLWGGRV